jgi:hypothetical protein
MMKNRLARTRRRAKTERERRALPAVLGLIRQMGLEPRPLPGAPFEIATDGRQGFAYRPGRTPAVTLARLWRGIATVNQIRRERAA